MMMRTGMDETSALVINTILLFTCGFLCRYCVLVFSRGTEIGCSMKQRLSSQLG